MSDRIITANYTLELSDYKRATWLHIKPRKTFAILGIGLLVLAAFALIAYVTKVPGKNQSGILIAAMTAGVVSLPLYLFYLLPRQCARIYQQTKLLREAVHCEITEDHFIGKQNSVECNIPWETFHKWKADKEIVLVYPNDAMFHIFPRRGFASTDDFEEFQKILKAKLRRAG